MWIIKGGVNYHRVCYKKFPSLKASELLNSRLNFEYVNVDLKLLVFLKPIHATWLVAMFYILFSYLGQGLFA